MSLAAKIIEVLFLFLICIGAFLGNFLLFLIVAKTPGLQTKGNVFILNLAAADLLVAFVNMPITIVTVISEDWILGKEVCLISGFFTLLTFVASCMALSMISVNRYHAIVHWTTYHRTYTRCRCVLYVGIVWGVTIALSIPPLFGWASFDFDKGQSYCFAEWTESKSYTIFMIVACLCGPLAIMIYCYVNIIKFKRDSQRRVHATSQTVESSVNSQSTVPNGEPFPRQNAAVRTDRKLTRTIMCLIVVFAFCWSPFAIIMIVQVFFGSNIPRFVDLGSLVLGYINSLLNVFVYNATNKNIRQAYKKLLTCKPNRVDIPSRSITVPHHVE